MSGHFCVDVGLTSLGGRAHQSTGALSVVKWVLESTASVGTRFKFYPSNLMYVCQFSAELQQQQQHVQSRTRTAVAVRIKPSEMEQKGSLNLASLPLCTMYHALRNTEAHVFNPAGCFGALGDCTRPNAGMALYRASDVVSGWPSTFGVVPGDLLFSF